MPPVSALFDRGEHRVVGPRPVDEQLGLVAGEQGWRAEVAHGGQVIVEQRGLTHLGQSARGAQCSGAAHRALGAFQVDGKW